MSETSRPRRRVPIRWLTLAELVGILALVVAALGWWDNHRERLQQDQERSAEARGRAAEAKLQSLKASFLLTGQVESDGRRVRLASAHPDQVIQTQTLVFPSAMGREPVETTGNPRLEADWLEGGLKKAGVKAGQPRRVPVGVLTTYVEDGEMRTDCSVYAVAAVLEGRFLRGSRLQMDGVSLIRRGVGGDLQAAVDAAWAR
jgi:hypothetical protein